ncbi:MAG TPA: helix-turn-helix domain-containing protein [Terriglobales bacterium]|nr:helix-turn-helix domain-containing protein [Terriglobales bacterium]
MILIQGRVLNAPSTELKTAAPAALAGTLEHAEREHIIEILRQANWVIGGSNGAAARLGLKRTTLLYKLTKLGISRRKV